MQEVHVQRAITSTKLVQSNCPNNMQWLIDWLIDWLIEQKSRAVFQQYSGRERVQYYVKFRWKRWRDPPPEDALSSSVGLSPGNRQHYPCYQCSQNKMVENSYKKEWKDDWYWNRRKTQRYWYISGNNINLLLSTICYTELEQLNNYVEHVGERNSF